jgi:Immunity protein 26
MKKVNEGDVVAITLEDGRYALGVLARVETKRPRKPYGIYVYFFGPYNLKESLPEIALSLKPHNSIISLNTSALSIYSDEWKKVASFTPWDRTAWPLPDLCQHNLGSEVYYRVRLDENDLVTPLSRIRMVNNGGLPSNDLYGSLAAEHELNRAMSSLTCLT